MFIRLLIVTSGTIAVSMIVLQFLGYSVSLELLPLFILLAALACGAYFGIGALYARYDASRTRVIKLAATIEKKHRNGSMTSFIISGIDEDGLRFALVAYSDADRIDCSLGEGDAIWLPREFRTYRGGRVERSFDFGSITLR